MEQTGGFHHEIDRGRESRKPGRIPGITTELETASTVEAASLPLRSYLRGQEHDAGFQPVCTEQAENLCHINILASARWRTLGLFLLLRLFRFFFVTVVSFGHIKFELRFAKSPSPGGNPDDNQSMLAQQPLRNNLKRK